MCNYEINNSISRSIHQGASQSSEEDYRCRLSFASAGICTNVVYIYSWIIERVTLADVEYRGHGELELHANQSMRYCELRMASMDYTLRPLATKR